MLFSCLLLHFGVFIRQYNAILGLNFVIENCVIDILIFFLCILCDHFFV